MVFFTSNFISDEAIGGDAGRVWGCAPAFCQPTEHRTKMRTLMTTHCNDTHKTSLQIITLLTPGSAAVFAWRVVRFLIAEHALLLLKVVIAAAVDDVPQDVQEQVRVDRAHDHFWSGLNHCSGFFCIVVIFSHLHRRT
eukprot:COSAG04_NODE_3978_length_2383_cov_5.202256_4_plen_138_part_00